MEYHKEYLRLGTIEMLVLNLLKKEDLPIYEIVGIFAKKTDCKYRLDPHLLRMIINELLYQGYVTTYKVRSEDGIMREYYHIEDSGREYFKKVTYDWLASLKDVCLILDMDYLS